MVDLKDKDYVCATKTDVDKLANTAWPKPDQQAGTGLCMQGGNKLRGAKGMADNRGNRIFHPVSIGCSKRSSFFAIF